MQQPGVIGSRVDRYLIERLLGMGGFGSVYRAKHVHTEATVALKLLKRSLGADQGMLDRFLREARAAASVGSEHIVLVTDAGIADGQAFLTLEYLDGQDLKDLAVNEAPLAHQRVVMIVLQALEGLAAAHAKGIVHRDMKPANVFVVRRRDERGTERDFVKLLDFGISKMHGDDGASSGLTKTGMAMGTPSYMAPEQFFDAKSVDGRADLYSVSAMLYELLSGRLPFDAESYAHLIVKVRTEQAPPLLQVAPQVPAALAQVVTVGLAKEPGQRWQSAKEFALALRSAMNLPAPGSTPVFLPSPSQVVERTPTQPAEPLEKTHTPRPVTAGPAPAPIASGVSSSWVVPMNGSANTGLPVPAAPLSVSMPGQMGAQAPRAAVVPPPTAPGATPTKSSAMKWVIGVLGVIFLVGGCCTCSVIYEASKDNGSPPVERKKPAKTPTDDEPAADEDPAPDDTTQ